MPQRPSIIEPVPSPDQLRAVVSAQWHISRRALEAGDTDVAMKSLGEAFCHAMIAERTKVSTDRAKSEEVPSIRQLWALVKRSQFRK
jgi:hypothetical protein